jgi:sugar lactone lactonase YvrE
MQAGLSTPTDVAIRADGGYVISDSENDAVRLVSPDGRISTIAGGELTGLHETPVSARLRFPTGLSALPDGRVLVADAGQHRVVSISPSGAVEVVVGDGHAGHAGDGGPAVSAQLSRPMAVAATSHGDVFIADTGNNRVRVVRGDGRIVTVAGTGVAGSSGDGGPAVLARLDRPIDVAALSDGTVAVATMDGYVRRLRPDGTITMVHRGRTHGAAALAAAADGSLVVADRGLRRIFRIAADGSVSILARGSCGDVRSVGRDGVLGSVAGVAAGPRGDVLIADSGMHRIVRLADGDLRAVAGAGLRPPPDACRPAGAPERILTRRPSQDPYFEKPSCKDRTYWTFNMSLIGIRPDRPRVRQPFRVAAGAAARVRYRFVAIRRGRRVRVPRRGTRTNRQVRIVVRFGRGLPRRGRWRLRFVAVRSDTTQCIDRRIVVRKMKRRR